MEVVGQHLAFIVAECEGFKLVHLVNPLRQEKEFVAVQGQRLEKRQFLSHESVSTVEAMQR